MAFTLLRELQLPVEPCLASLLPTLPLPLELKFDKTDEEWFCQQHYADSREGRPAGLS